MRVGEAELHQARALIDRRGRHRGGAGKVAQFDDDLGIADEFLRDGDGLTRIGLTVLEHVLQRPPLHAGLVDLLEREIEALFPLRAVLGVLACQRSAHSDRHGLARGLREGGGRSQSAQHSERCDAPDQKPTAAVGKGSMVNHGKGSWFQSSAVHRDHRAPCFQARLRYVLRSGRQRRSRWRAANSLVTSLRATPSRRMTWATIGSSSISQRVSSRSLGGSGLCSRNIVCIVISKNKLDRRPNMTSRTKTNNRAIFAADLRLLAPDLRYGDTESIRRASPWPSLRGALATKQSRGRVTRPWIASLRSQ